MPQVTTAEYSKDMSLAQTIIKACQGDKKAQVALGDMYKDGVDFQQDYQAAMGWYLKATRQGDPIGQRKVCLLYDYGLGVAQDYSAAMEWYLEAADQKHPEAQYNIGILFD
jgi:TPR repeat protein